MRITSNNLTALSPQEGSSAAENAPQQSQALPEEYFETRPNDLPSHAVKSALTALQQALPRRIAGDEDPHIGWLLSLRRVDADEATVGELEGPYNSCKGYVARSRAAGNPLYDAAKGFVDAMEAEAPQN